MTVFLKMIVLTRNDWKVKNLIMGWGEIKPYRECLPTPGNKAVVWGYLTKGSLIHC